MCMSQNFHTSLATRLTHFSLHCWTYPDFRVGSSDPDCVTYFGIKPEQFEGKNRCQCHFFFIIVQCSVFDVVCMLYSDKCSLYFVEWIFHVLCSSLVPTAFREQGYT